MARKARRTDQPTLTERMDALEVRIDRQRIANVALYAVTLVVVLVAGYTAFANHKAFCSFHDDLRRRVVGTQDYLAKHQQKTIFGVPRSTLVTNLNDEERTLDSLSGLHC